MVKCVFSAVEPSLSGVTNLLSNDEVDIGDVVDKLENIVNYLIESGQTASANFTEVSTDICKHTYMYG